MERVSELLRYAAGLVLIAGGIVGTIASLMGIETISPAYFAVAIAAGAGALPEAERALCRIRSRLPV
ncbi:hypothetical protein [Natrinema salaciae]|uniref:Uncharacterized protein n=1 Tax=Natrinema salaciae TaxID=1186196 RepID=A0A1H9H3Y3_9EURY|nr:hypothetical protein [Natrinema salaciae]SEQ57040.1 hypothetical protein SAMN04489841_2087 [Natrinema salaciae]